MSWHGNSQGIRQPSSDDIHFPVCCALMWLKSLLWPPPPPGCPCGSVVVFLVGARSRRAAGIQEQSPAAFGMSEGPGAQPWWGAVCERGGAKGIKKR